MQVIAGINNLWSSVDNKKNLAFTVVNNTIFEFKGPWDLSLLSFVVKDDPVDTVVYSYTQVWLKIL
jgi:hypothetical protein